MNPSQPISFSPNLAPAGGGVAAVVPPFAPAALERELATDKALRWTVVAAVVAVLLLGAVWESIAPRLSLVATFAVGVLWIAVSLVSTRVWRSLPRITMLLDQDPPSAEAALAAAMKRRPLQRTVRLLLYHRLAVLRHRQGRFAEAAAICQAVLAQPLGLVANVRGNLLLMLAESCLESGDLSGAHAALSELHRVPLGLLETLQRLSLQLRYEVACGYDAQALHGLSEKIDLIELMPQPQCGLMHALLARSAQRAGLAESADWLKRRAELLCSPEQLAAVWGGSIQSTRD